MADVVESKKACAVNPLKMSQPLGASFAFLGLEACMPVMHGSQGCTSFGLVLLVLHFKEAIALQTTAMNEVTSILGGYDNIESALLNIRKRAAPKIIAICSTGLTETKGDDVDGYIVTVRKRKPELADTEIVYVSTPDYVGAFEDGYKHAVTAIIRTLVKPLLRIGFPVFDRIGNAHRCQVGYRGTMALVFEMANLMLEKIPHHYADDWPIPPETQRAATRVSVTSTTTRLTEAST